ncbi:MAG TPA: hypothetical protein DCG47_01920 [Spirochaetaceae bacterium]|nr:hypothetical protein [Spirochaetaceae bacterium]
MIDMVQKLLPLAGLLALIAAAFALASCASMERQALRYVAAAQALPAPFLSDAVMPAPQGGGEWVASPAGLPGSVISREDIEALPPAAKRYFDYAGVEGTRRVASYSVILSGRIRNGPEAAWMPLTMRQYNRVDAPARVVYLESTKPPMAGVDSFVDGSGRMQIKVMNLIRVADSKGPEMDASALVTFLNDLVLCPSAYFSLPLRWRHMDDGRVELAFSHAGMSVRALLTADDEGRLIDWSTEDRYADVKGASLKDRWSTPFGQYGEQAGLRIPMQGAGIHDYDGQPYVYVELDRITELTLNAEGLPKRP